MKPSPARPTPLFPHPKPAARGSAARISRHVVGLAPSGDEVSLFVLDTGSGSAAQVLDYGATLAALHVPDARGDSGPVVLAPGSLQGHLADRMYLGATVGRFANRIAGACALAVCDAGVRAVVRRRGRRQRIARRVVCAADGVGRAAGQTDAGGDRLVDQHGRVQSVGAINEEVEGFFDICRRRELAPEQGVIIPRSNVKNLMLRQDVVEAARMDRFRIHAVDDALELLTGRAAGKRDANGRFPEGSVNALVEARLLTFAERARLLAAKASET